MAITFNIVCGIIVLLANYSYAAVVKPVDLPPHYKDPLTGMELVYVKGGCYQMGATNDDCDASPDERPAHEVCVNDYYLGKYEVTQGEWKSVMGSNTSTQSTCGGDNCPVDNISWNDVQDFIGRLNRKTGGGKYRLPTEAEWEYAARSGGKSEKYSGGKDANIFAWYGENSGRKNRHVGAKAPNGLGIYDMSGNVWEMTYDWYASDYYKNSPRDNPSGPVSGGDRVVRGGSSVSGVLSQRTTRRNCMTDRTKGKDRGGDVGFRLLMSL